MKNNTLTANKKLPFELLSGNMLKLIGCIFMTADHIGLLLLPSWDILRSLGRLAFPIFAFFIAEGCRYTRSKARYLLTMLSLAAIFQVVYFIAMDETDLCIFVTFSIGIALVYLFDKLKSMFFRHAHPADTATVLLLFILALLCTYALNIVFFIDYGFLGCITPLLVSVFFSKDDYPERFRRLDNKWTSLAMFAVGMILLSIFGRFDTQFFCLFTIPLLALYSGKRGKARLKYFFYIFYPAHIIIIYGIYLLLSL